MTEETAAETPGEETPDADAGLTRKERRAKGKQPQAPVFGSAPKVGQSSGATSRKSFSNRRSG